MDLHDAITSLTVIRQQLAETETFRGYRALPVACSAILALLTGWLQPYFVPNPLMNTVGYVLLWSTVAAVSIGMVGLTIWLRDNFCGTSKTRAVTWLAVSQFAPCIGSAALTTLVVMRFIPELAWLLPIIWQLFFSQGVFAACRLLPRPTIMIGVFYLFSGLVTLILTHGGHELHPWAMALPFGVGQLLSAATLYWTVERQHATS